MTWLGVLGHDQVVEQFRRAIARHRLVHAFLFLGPPGIGKRTFAHRLAESLLCNGHRPDAMLPCGNCESCRLAHAGNHPDLLMVAKPADKSFIPLELLIGDADHRMQQGLCHDIALRPFLGGRRVAIIDGADYLNEEGANCLLKTLEEPPPHSVLILIGTSAERQLPTIRSRCQPIRFQPPSIDEATELIAQHLEIADRGQARHLALAGGGSLEQAAELTSPELWTFRERLLRGLTLLPSGCVNLAGEITTFVDGAGKEAPKRRARLRLVIGFAIDFYGQLLRQLEGATSADGATSDAEMQAALTAMLASHPDLDAEVAAGCLERSLEALSHVERNVHPTTLLEGWIDDLATLAAGLPLGRTLSF